MTEKLIFKCPINSLSFGNVSVNVLYQLYKKGINVCVLPVGDKADLSAFDNMPMDFKKWVGDAISDRYKEIKRETPFLNLWHILGSETKVSDKNVLYTFYEASAPTPEEVNLANLYDATCFSSKSAKEAFSRSGCNNPIAVPLGLDPFFKPGSKRDLDKIRFSLIGKWEKRKHTTKIIQTWIDAYGNNYDYELNCLVTNRFLNKERRLSDMSLALNGKTYGNVNFIPWLETNSEVNNLLNSTDIDLSGMSGAEGWNLPSFNSTALGGWSIVLNCTSHKDWATESNCILIEPNGTESLEDGIFFTAGSPFNKGVKHTFSREELTVAMRQAESKCLKENEEGKKLSNKFSYEKMTDSLLEICRT